MAVPGRSGSNIASIKMNLTLKNLALKILTVLAAVTVGASLVMPWVFPSYAAGFTTPTYSAADQIEWTMGYGRNTNGMSRGMQGTNGWYCLYSAQTNRHGSFDTGTFKMTKYGNTKCNWKYYGVVKNWSPNEYLLTDYDNSENGNWWLMDGNGRMDPNVAAGAFSGIYGWAAPRDSTYLVSMDYTAGGGNASYDDGFVGYASDGVTLSINTDSGAKAVAETPATNESNPDLTSGNLSKRIKLSAGQMVYFIVDPQGAGDYDTAQLYIVISATDEPEDPEESEGAGEGSGDGNGEGVKPEGGHEDGDKDKGDDKPAASKPGKGTDAKPGPGGSGGDGVPNTNPNNSKPSVPNMNLASNTQNKPKTEDKKQNKDTGVYLIKSKELQSDTDTEEGVTEDTLKEAEGGHGAEEDVPAPSIPVVLVGIAEIIGGGALFSAARYIRNVR